MNGKEVSKVCGICGDKAHGYNFNAITCESCKAFFRRNALRKKEFKCPFEDKCKIDLVTRKFCKKCRLKKCFDIGMKKEWILSDEEKINLRNKIAENRKKRHITSKVSKVADSTTTTHFPNVVQLIQNSYAVSNDKMPNTECQSSQYEYKIVERLEPLTQTPHTFVELSQSSGHSGSVSNLSAIREQSDEYRPNCDSLVINSSIRECNDCFNGQCFEPKEHYLMVDEINSQEMLFTNKCLVITDGSIENLKNNSTENYGNFSTNSENFETKKSVIQYNKKDEIPDKVYQKAIELEFADIPIKEMLSNLSNEDFNKYESQRITELSEAMKDFNKTEGVATHHTKITPEFMHFLDATKYMASKCDEAIRRLVVMSKKITAFKNLCQHDQIALMKASCFEILIMRSVKTYNSENEYWPITNMDQNNVTKLNLDVFKQTKRDFYEVHKKFMKSFKVEWNEWNSSPILDVLTAIVLFTPDRSNVIHREIIKLEQQTYMYLLQRYLLSRYKSKCEAKMKFLKLMSILEELHSIHEQHVRIYLEVDPQDIGPLLIEILDLNPYNTIQLL